MEGSKVVVKAGSCMMSQQEIRPNNQDQYPSNVYVSHVLGDMEYYSYPVLLEAEGLLQRLMRNNCGDKCANIRTDKGNTAKPKRGARLISKENPGKIYVAFTNCETRDEYDAKFQSYYMKNKDRTNVEVDENGRKVVVQPCYFSGRTMHSTYVSGRKQHLTDETGRKPHPRTLVNKDDLYTVKCKHCDTVRSVNKAPAMLYCAGGCKKQYCCNLELGSNKHWEVIAEADDPSKQHLTDETGKKPHPRTLVKKDDKYTVECKHCQTVRSVNKAPAQLYCKGVCKKNYSCNLQYF